MLIFDSEPDNFICEYHVVLMPDCQLVLQATDIATVGTEVMFHAIIGSIAWEMSTEHNNF